MGDTESSPGHHDAVADVKEGSSRSRFRLVAYAASALSLAAVLVPVLVRLTGWEAGPLAYAVSLLPWVGLACVIPLGLALLARSRALVVATLVPFVAGIGWLVPIFDSWSMLNGSDTELRVATINATLGQADADAIVAMVKDHSIDVLAVQELTPTEVEDLRAAGIDGVLPYSELAPQRGVEGTGLWPRLPMDGAESVPGLSSHVVRAAVTAGPEPVTIFAVHPAAPGLFDHSRWALDMEALEGVLAEGRDSTIVAGDFNTTRDHRAFRDLEALGFRDAVDDAGAGFLPTFPSGRLPFPLVAIDHVIAQGSSLVAVSASTMVIPGADHRALVATYVWQH